MKKTNKILTRALVILLTLVLITSSVVSSTFAKYVVSKEAKTTVGLNKFGLKVDLDTTALGTADSSKQKGDSISLTFNNITLIPGDPTYKNALKATISGTPTVNAMITITVDIEAEDSDFNITSQNFNTLTPGQLGVYNPITFYVGEQESGNTTYAPLSGDSDKLASDVETAVCGKIATALSGSVTGNTITKNLTAGTDKDLNYNIGVGFEWKHPTGATGDNCLDEIATWISSSSALAEDDSTTFDITYTIKVEQVIGA